MIKYYVGGGSDILHPSKCDGPFGSVEEAKEFMLQFDIRISPSEILDMIIVVADTDKMILSPYKENEVIVTLRDVHYEND